MALVERPLKSPLGRLTPRYHRLRHPLPAASPSSPSPSPTPTPTSTTTDRPPAMSEIRRKLVIVGDGACGKVRPACRRLPPVLTVSWSPDLSLDRVLERHIPGGEQQARQPGSLLSPPAVMAPHPALTRP